MQADKFISSDPVVSAIFAAVKEQQCETVEKLKAIVRAGKIAEAYLTGGEALNCATAALNG